MQKNKVFISLILIFMWCCKSAIAQTDTLIKNQVAVFYPKGYHATAHQPSAALMKEPVPMGKIPDNWNKKPSFYSKKDKTYATFSIPKGCNLYGTGENTGTLLRNGKTVTLWNTDNYEYKKNNGERLYQSHPWVLGVNPDGTAFGVMADNTWRQQIQLTDSIRFISEGPAFRVFVILGKTPQEVIQSLSQLVGTMALPPIWALGYHQCRFSYIPDTRIKSLADTFRMKNLPCDVIWMDIDYMDHFKIFTFDPTKMPDPKNLNNYLHRKEFKSIWMIDPGVKAEKGFFVYDSGSKGNHWVQDSSENEYHGNVWPGPCAFPDFTRPETRVWWGGLYQEFMATGIDGVWNDMNEPTVFEGPDGTMPENNFHRGGDGLSAGSHLRFHNIYGTLMVKASREGILRANPGKRPFILSRSGFLGSHRYAATWTGDNLATEEHMKLSIPMSLNLGLSGQAFSGPDVGGFSGNTSPDLFGQWIAVGAFYPFMRGHAGNQTISKEPWAFGSEIENVSRMALNRRYRLLPYLYTLFQESSTTGMPVMQPVFFADCQDTSLRKEEQAFLLGKDLLVVPKWAEKPTLPKGIWRVVSLAGENSLTDTYQPDVKVRGGAILPLGRIIQNTTHYQPDSLTLVVVPDSDGFAAGTLYEDAGDGFGYQKGDFLLSVFTAKQSGKSLTLKITSKAGKRNTDISRYRIVVVTEQGSFTSSWRKGKRIRVNLSAPDKL